VPWKCWLHHPVHAIEDSPRDAMWHISSANEAASHLEGGHTATLISCYAPTLAASQDEKEEFYEQLSLAIDAVAFKDNLFMLGDFNARLGGITNCGTESLGGTV